MGRAFMPALAAGMALAACAGGDEAQVKTAADEYIAGVQYRDALSVVKRQAVFRAQVASSPPAAWEELRRVHQAAVDARFAEYDAAKAAGHLPLGEDGVNLLQGLAIGKGIFYAFQEIRVEAEGGRAAGIMEVLPDYEEHRFRGLPPGTRVYFLGDPLTRLQTVTLGRSAAPQSVRVPSRVLLEWRFRRFDAVDVYPAGWAVESIRALDEGLEMIDLERVF